MDKSKLHYPKRKKSHPQKSPYCTVLPTCNSGKGEIIVPKTEDQRLEIGGGDYLSRDMRELWTLMKILFKTNQIASLK